MSRVSRGPGWSAPADGAVLWTRVVLGALGVAIAAGVALTVGTAVAQWLLR